MAPIMFGLLGGAGLVLMGLGLARSRPTLAASLAELATPNLAGTASAAAKPWERLADDLTRSSSGRLDADLMVLERDRQFHAIDKIRTALFWGLFGSGWVVVIGLIGTSWPIPVVAIAFIVCSIGGWLLADAQVRRKAAERRVEFRSNLITYLQLVTVLLAGGAGVNQALTQAAAYGRGWTFAVLSRSLRDAQARRLSPWDGFAETAEQLELTPLRDLAASMRLAGESGAHVRESLTAKAESLRVHELTEIEADAAAATEKMGGPVGAMVVGFVITIGYPAFDAILQI